MCGSCVYHHWLTSCIELIGEEIYDEFDAEGESHLKSYVSPRTTKRRISRGREARAVRIHTSPAAPSEGTTVTSTKEPAQLDAPAVLKSHSQPASLPASPNLSALHEEGPISRTSSLGQLGQSLTSLMMGRKTRSQPPDDVHRSRSPAGTGVGGSRENSRQQQRQPRSEGETANVGPPPLSGLSQQITDVQEEHQDGLRIPDAHERNGPDIAQHDEDENKE